jgi:hypothetical protein
VVVKPFKEHAVTPAAVELSQVMLDDPTVMLKCESALATGIRASAITQTIMASNILFINRSSEKRTFPLK